MAYPGTLAARLAGIARAGLFLMLEQLLPLKSLKLSTSSQAARLLWRRAVKDPGISLVQALERKRYASLWARQITGTEANQRILQLLSDSQPFLVGRIGHTEGRIVGEALFCGGRYGRLTCKEAHQYSGIFPVSPDTLDRFAAIYAEAISQVDLLGFWQTTFQARLLSECYPEIPVAPLPSLEPYLSPSPWSAALAGRRVLVVHPFAETISRQFEQKRHLIFSDSRVLPPFELQVLSPPQTLAPLTEGFQSWLEALASLKERVLGQAFDVALLGCGAYGLPLGAAIKHQGRQVIHLGGALQILFGIRGRRWESIPKVRSLMNKHWISASEKETPASAQSVDGGCYW